MMKFAPLSIAVALTLAAVAGAVFGLSIGAPPRETERARSTDGAPRPDAPPAPASVPSAAPDRSAAGRAASLDEAIRELDLIRPSRRKIAEDFALPLTDGKTFRLSEQRGKMVLVNFWATWCPPCREEMPAMERLYREHKDKGLVLVAVSIDSDPAVVPPYVAASKLTFPIALDPKADIANKYGVRALPSSFIVDRDGAMVALALGPRVWDNTAAHALVRALTR